MSGREHIHTPHDGRGIRKVFLNGEELKHVVYADTKEGAVELHAHPLRLDKNGNLPVERRFGDVRVEFPPKFQVTVTSPLRVKP